PHTSTLSLHDALPIWIDFRYQHTLLPFHSDAVSAVGRKFFHVQAKLRRRRFTRLVAQWASRIREYSRAVSDLCGRFFLRAVAHIDRKSTRLNSSHGSI